jgi:transcriptional regulator of arginine metabolism
MNRNERHAAILRLVREQPLSTQAELADALRREGHEVVQTTVSRDIHELGLIKVRHASGRLVYAFAEDGGYSEELSGALTRWALTVEPSGNLVVLTTPYGYASALAQAIDVARHPHIAGTIAGENTVMLVSREPHTGAELADEIRAQRLQGAA